VLAVAESDAGTGNTLRTFYIASNGCIRRRLEAQRVVDFMLANGYSQVSDGRNADYLLYFACAACSQDEEMAKRAIERMVERGGAESKLILGGCLIKTCHDYCHSLSQLRGVLLPGRLDEIETMVRGTTPMSSIPRPTRVTSVQHDEPGEKAEPLKNEIDGGLQAFRRTCETVVICQGCLSACSYCCIRFSTGRLESTPISEITGTCRELYKRGSKRFVLTGEDTGAYGIDLGTDLLQLVRAVSSIGPAVEIAINSMNPRWMCSKVDKIERLLQDTVSIRHVHIPIQSASDRMLAAMNRKYSVGGVRRLFDVFRSFGEDCQVHTHLIVGFPGETSQDLEDTIRFIREYSDIHYSAFPYSDRPGTASFECKQKTPSPMIWERLKKIRGVLAETNTLSPIEGA
jgi:MiaB/RimO family radical SAM methylthiotransferase